MCRIITQTLEFIHERKMITGKSPKVVGDERTTLINFCLVNEYES